MTASQQITTEVTSWGGVEAGPGRRGEFAFKVGRREIGHLDGDHAADFSFPKDVWADLLVAERRRVGYLRRRRRRPPPGVHGPRRTGRAPARDGRRRA